MIYHVILRDKVIWKTISGIERDEKVQQIDNIFSKLLLPQDSVPFSSRNQKINLF